MKLKALCKNWTKKQYITMGVIASILVIISTLIGVSIWHNKPKDNDLVKSAGEVLESNQTNENTGHSKVMKESIVNDTSVNVESLDNTNHGMVVTPRFKVTTDKPLGVAAIKERLQFEPKRDYTVEKIDDQAYLVAITEPYKYNTIVKANYTSDASTKGWAFQTEQAFGVASTHPSKEGKHVPRDSGIEWTFTKDVGDSVIDDYVTIEPHVEGEYKYVKNQVILIPDTHLEGNREYKVTLKKGYSNGEKKLEEDYIFSFHTNNYSSDTTINLEGSAGDMTYMPSGSSQTLECYYNNDDNEDVDIQIYRYASAVDFIAGYESYQDYALVEYIDRIEAKEKISYKAEVHDGNFGRYIELQPLDDGYYFLTARVGRSIDKMFIQVTPYNGYTAVDQDKFLVWMVDSLLGAPVEDAKIIVNGEELGETDEQGFAMINKSLNQEEVSWVGLQANGQLPLYLPTHIAKHEPKGDQLYWSYLYSDRGMYLPTDEVQIFGFVQSKKGRELQRVRVSLESSNGIIIEEQEVALSDIGTYQTKFKLENYLSGYVHVIVRIDDLLVDQLYVDVTRFEKPVVDINTSLDKEFIMMGDSVNYQANVSFYEGTPAAYAKININGDRLGIESSYQVCDEQGGKKLVMTPEVSTTRWRPMYVRIDTQYEGLEKVYISDTTGLIVFPKDMMVTCDTKKMGDEVFDINVEMHHIDIEGFQGEIYDEDDYRGKPAEGQPISIEIVERYYEKVYGGKGYDHISKISYDIYSYVRHENTVKTLTGITDHTGRCTFTFDEALPERGYRVNITTEDSRGRTIADRTHYSEASQRHYDIYDRRYFTASTDKSKYKKEEQIQLSINQGSDPIPERENDYVLYFMTGENIMDYGITDKTSTTLPYLNKYIPYAHLHAVYFDGMSLHRMSHDTGISYNYEDEELTIDIETNKQDYRPGDHAKIKVKVTNYEKMPVQADVNINIVDEAFLVMCDDVPHALGELYQSWYFYESGLIGEAFASYYKKNDGHMAEGGGEGGGSFIRSNFKNTGDFQTIMTNKQGIGEAIFTIPDNLTSWRIFTTAMDKQVRAGNATCNVNSTLPFFITTILYDHYLEGDEIEVTVKPAGDQINEQTDITYTAIVDLEDGNQKEVSTKNQGIGYINLELGSLPVGKHKVTIIGKTDSLEDGVAYDIEIMETFHYFPITQEGSLTEETALTSNGQDVNLTFFNRVGYNYYSDLMRIYNKKNALRNDIKVAAYVAGKAINQFYHMDLEVDYILPESFDRYKGLYSAFGYSEKSAITTAELISVGYIRDEANLRQDLLVEAVKGVTKENKIAALWALTMLDEPVLMQLQELYNIYIDQPINLETMILMEALLDIGDMEKGKKLYERVEKTMARGEGTYYVNGFDYNIKFTAMMMMAALKLDKTDDAKAMKAYLDSVGGGYYPIITEELYYMQNTVPKKNTASFSYKLDGKVEDVTLDQFSYYELNLPSEDADRIQFMNIDGDIHHEQSFIGRIKDIDRTDRYRISRWYTTENHDDAIKQGEIVTVHLKIDIEDPYVRYFEIDDILPAGLTYLGYGNITPGAYSYVWIDDEVHQMHINAYCHREKWNTKPVSYEITYRAKAVLPGRYTAEPVVIKDSMYHDATYSEIDKVEIR